MRTRSFLLAAALSMTLVPSAFAGEAYEDLVLARDACGGTDPANTRLAFYPGAASTGGCGGLLAGISPSTTTYPAAEGVPFTLADDGRPIYVAISSSSYAGVALGGIGAQTVEVRLTGVNDATKKTVTLGSETQETDSATMLRQASSLNEFEFDVTNKGGVYKSLTLTLTVGGSELAGFVDHDGASYVSLPITGETNIP